MPVEADPQKIANQYAKMQSDNIAISLAAQKFSKSMSDTGTVTNTVLAAHNQFLEQTKTVCNDARAAAKQA